MTSPVIGFLVLLFGSCIFVGTTEICWSTSFKCKIVARISLFFNALLASWISNPVVAIEVEFEGSNDN